MTMTYAKMHHIISLHLLFDQKRVAAGNASGVKPYHFVSSWFESYQSMA